MKSVRQIIWSKNRAMQLHLLLRSQRMFFPEIERTVIIYKATTPEYEAGYAALKKWVRSAFGYKVMFHPESNFSRDLYYAIYDGISSDFILGNSDDNVFVSRVQWSDCIINLFDEQVVAMSLRLNPQVNFCQPANLLITPPELQRHHDAERDVSLYRWRWADADPMGCWGYPHPCDSHLYRTKYLHDLVLAGIDSFNDPCSLEIWMNTHRESAPPYMLCYDKSRLISVCANRIQDSSTNPSGTINPSELNDRFLCGEQILVEPFCELNPQQCHINMEYQYGTRPA